DRALGEGAVPLLAPRRAADRLRLARRERREVVVQHERLRRLGRDVDVVDPLLVVLRTERDHTERLRRATREQGAAVRARQDADLARDRPDLVRLAAVRAHALLDDLA